MPRSAVLIFNPQAGRWKAAEQARALVAFLQGRDFAIEPTPTRGPGDATPLARRAAETGVEVAFVLGGDGTLREAAAGLLGSSTILAPLPGGTTNVVVGALGIPPQPVAAAGALCTAPVREVDVGLCGAEPFLMLTSAGLDAYTLRLLSPSLKKRFGKGAVAWTGFRAWQRYSYPQIEVVADGRSMQATFAAVCNLPAYAGGFKLAPRVRADDGCLHLVLSHGVGRAAALGFARDLAIGRHHLRRDVEILGVEEVELRAPATLDLQIDGDTIDATLPLSIRLAAARLKVLAPSDRVFDRPS
jgi:diacylglycerol kinase family enzyme